MYPDRSSLLSIRLTEPVVPLRITSERASRHHDDEALSPAIVRGLLILKLVRPTKVSSIELELQAKAVTHYTQGAGPSRVDITEQYNVHSASMILFKAGPVSQERRRATSTRPRVQLQFDDHSGSTARHGILPNSIGVTRSTSLDPLHRRRPNSDAYDYGRGPQQSQFQIDPVPPYPGHSFLSVDSTSVGRSQSVASTSRFTEPRGSPIPSPGSMTSDSAYHLPESCAHSIPGIALSRTPSIEEVPENETESLEALCPDNVAYYGLSPIETGFSGRGTEQDSRGRSRSRFSFGRVVDVFEAVKERVRSRSPQAGSQPRSDDQERGRSLTKGKGRAQDSIQLQTEVAEPSVADGTNDHNSDGWAVFPEGTYTYPVFFTIPNNSPPTMKAEHGSLIWKVKAEVKRPGVFKPNMTTQKDVIVICAPKDDDSENIVEGIDLQRQWEERLQYRVQIAGRGVPIGGKMPIQFTMTPLAKVKIHSIFAYLDERTEYYMRTQSRARSDVIRRTTLLGIRHNNSDHWHSKPVLPLTSDEPDAFRKSPLYRFLRPGEDESEVASSYMGPGPWTIHHELSIPDSCSILHPSNQVKHSNVMVNHTLRLALRVEKEQGITTAGRKKLYDIVIHFPIQILSCHCTSEWSSLPRYDEVLQSGDHSPEDTSTCPCHSRLRAKARTHSHAADTLPEPMDASPLDSLAGCTHLHEQLMSGSLSERGEAPPSYEQFEDVH